MGPPPGRSLALAGKPSLGRPSPGACRECPPPPAPLSCGSRKPHGDRLRPVLPARISSPCPNSSTAPLGFEIWLVATKEGECVEWVLRSGLCQPTEGGPSPG